ncbi:hypothetical protein JXM67_13575 [candidate division WOR-3 bacterium]|nr:hypothetical protein [candidate division WOR-3 bacterium]
MSGKRRGCLIISSVVGLFLLNCLTQEDQLCRIGRVKIGVAYDVFVHDDYAYVSNNDGVVVIDISDRTKPRKVALIDTDGAFGITVVGDYACVCGWSTGFTIVNIKNPQDPKILGTCFENISPYDVCANDSTMYGIYFQGELRGIDTRDPSSPSFISQFDEGGRLVGIALSQNVVYLANADSGLVVIDVTDPADPLKLKTVDETIGAWNVQVNGELLFLGCHQNGIRILDISDPTSPVLISSIADVGETYGVFGDSTHLCAADLQRGVWLYDITDPDQPRLITSDSRYSPHSVYYDGQYIYLADESKGFVILEYTQSQ